MRTSFRAESSQPHLPILPEAFEVIWCFLLPWASSPSPGRGCLPVLHSIYCPWSGAVFLVFTPLLAAAPLVLAEAGGVGEEEIAMMSQEQL